MGLYRVFLKNFWSPAKETGLPAFCQGNLMLRPIYTERHSQLCNDAGDTSMIEDNGFAPEWGFYPL